MAATILDKTHRTIKDLPMPKATPFIGHFLEYMNGIPHQVVEKWSKECGPIFKVNFMGMKIIIVTDAKLNRIALQQQPDKYRRYKKIDTIVSSEGIKGIFNAEGDMWRHHRKIANEALNPKNMKAFFPTVVKVTERFYNRAQQISEQALVVDVQKELAKYTVDILTEFAFGYPMNTVEGKSDIIQEHLEIIFPMFTQRVYSPIPWHKVYKSRKDKKFDTALTEIRNTIMNMMVETRKKFQEFPETKNNPTNFLEALLIEQEKNPDFSDEEIYGNVFSILLAGQDTTANTISWALYYIAQNPEIIKKIREEANQVYPNATCATTLEQANKLTYTRAVAKETMRMKPVLPNRHLETVDDVMISDVFVKKGTYVTLQTMVAQNDDKHFSQADVFMPERWIQNACPALQNHDNEAILTLGSGVRFCPAKNLINQEMVLTISMLCKNFDISLEVRPDEVEESYVFVIVPKNVKIAFKKAETITA